ncbi:MAG TPA: nuclear transport factor 2 family protein, partial [Acidothermaceae bacterium]
EGDRINHCEVYDDTDLDAALVRFEELQPQAPRLENAASQIIERYLAHFAARDWAAFAELLADDVVADDRRRVVNAGIRRGRDVHIADMRATVEVSAPTFSSSIIATRGERLALTHVRIFNRGMTGEVGAEALGIGEIDADERIVATVSFDPDDIDAAYEELDARYLAGEAGGHAHTWSVIARECAAFNRHELPATDWVTIDHRQLAPIDASDLQAAMRAVWDLTPDLSTHIEAVHRLSSFGAVVTYTAHGTSREGFDAEWRMIEILTVERTRLNRCEIFDEADLDAALARFEELRPQAPRPENTAGRIVERYFACFSARDWAAMAELLADDIVADDRRRVVNAGVRRGRDVFIADTRAAADVGFTIWMSGVVATRGERLALTRVGASGRDSETIQLDVLHVVEIGADELIAAVAVFDLDDIDAAYEDLDARYLAGEAAAHTRTWTLVTRAYAALNRRQLPETTVDWVNIDHRRLAPIAAGDLGAYLLATWDLSPQSSIRIETVHRLSEVGAVVTHVVEGTSQEGFDAEWRTIDLATYEGDKINRSELFDEADLDAALARFAELQPPARRLENAATQVAERLRANFAARDWTARAELLADDCSTDDRRRVVNAGNQHGRDADIANMRAIAAVGVANIALTPIATRGERLALSRARMSGRDQRPEAFYTETLTILEVNTNNRAAAQVVFDPDDIDAALAELDARYLAGEAAAHAHTWSTVTGAYASLNRHELLPTTQDWVNVDHHRLVRAESGHLTAYTVAAWNVSPDMTGYIEAVHRLSNFGTVVTLVVHGTSQEGFDAEWREVELLMFEGDRINRLEIFDEEDLDAALARFDELQPQTPRLENAASQHSDRYLARCMDGDWDAITEMLADDYYTDDRRRVVGGGIHGRDVEIENLRAGLDLGVTNATSHTIATRGERLVLTHVRYWFDDQRPEAFFVEILAVLEIDTYNRSAAAVVFDPDDIDAALAELDARYLAGEATAHAHTWSLVTRAYAAFNRREFPSTTPDSVLIDHRPLQTLGAVDLVTSARSIFDIAPDLSSHIEAVHRLGELGAVVTHTLKGTSQEGFDAEWRTIEFYAFEGDLLSRCEAFDEEDLDAALARFEELQPQARRLENAAT